ncbi:MAG: MBL fold metallo-hydrolase, partial [Clostridiales bacterium]|nr:MBL fold metallo-hydrolase [Clostridiales bacterium]
MAKKSAAKKALGNMKMTTGVKVALAVILTVILGASCIFTRQIDEALRLGVKASGGADGGSDSVALNGGVLSAHFINVGQGDSTILKFPDDKTMIVDFGDTGSMKKPDGGAQSIREKIIGYIDENISGGDENFIFDYAILTHSDSDHCGNMKYILEKYPARIIYRPNVIAANGGFIDPAIAVTDSAAADVNEKLWTLSGAGYADVAVKTTAVYTDAVSKMYEQVTRGSETFTPKVIVSDGRRGAGRGGKPLQDISGRDAAGDPYSVTFYGPQSPRYKSGASDEWNNCSNISVTEYQGKKILMSGDAEKAATDEFVAAYGEITFDVDVIKLGHHGS